MSQSQSKIANTPPPRQLGEGGVAQEGGVTVFGPDELIQSGILDEIPAGCHPDQYCMAVSTQILGGRADLGATLLRANSRGHWEKLGGFLELYDLGEKLDKQRSTVFPTLMEALREGYSKSSFSQDSCQALGFDIDGHMFAAGLSRPAFGVLILGSSDHLEFSPTGLKLLVSVTEMWLARGEYTAMQTAPVPQVNGDNSTVIFTERQLEVLRLLGDGKTNTEIGKKLSISASLAKQEVAFLAHALQAKNRLDVVVQAQRQGILAVGVK